MHSDSKDLTVGCLIIIVTFLLITGMAGCGIFHDYQTSEGFRDGQIQKFSHKGFIWVTWEGELALEGIRQNAGKMNSCYEFTVRDNDLAKIIQELPINCKVRVYYKEVLWGMPWNGSTSHYVYKVEKLPNK